VNTTLINLWGGPGSGKSTTAADLFARMKLKGISCELVREYVKNWAWRGDKIGPWDDVYIFAKQLRLESCLYGKVEYIITDSPIEIGALYEQLYNPDSTFMQDVVLAARNRQIAAGIRIEDFLIRRNKAYVKEGRYQDETKHGM
jgi:tRNA uridine 5-carbamoylmethylation protein Kti12